MVLNPNSFDGGGWLVLVLLGLTFLFGHRKVGGILLGIGAFIFLIAGLVVLTGDDVAFFQKNNPTISTVTLKNVNGTVISTQTTVITIPQNQTNYIIGNGQFPITGEVQLVIGGVLLALGILSGALCIDSAFKGYLLSPY